MPTWIDPLTPQEVWTQARIIFGVAPVMLIGAYGLWRLVARRSPLVDAPRWDAMAPGLALLLFPVVLTILSVVLQPVLRSKYMIATVIPMGMLAALVSVPITAKRGGVLAAVACLALVVIGAVEMRKLRLVSADGVVALDRAIAATDSLIAAGVPRPIVFLRRFEQEPVLQQRPGDASATALIDFDGDGGGLSRMWVFERDMARRVNRAYPHYNLASVESLARLPQFFVIAGYEGDAVLRQLFPRCEIRVRSAGIYALTLR